MIATHAYAFTSVGSLRHSWKQSSERSSLEWPPIFPSIPGHSVSIPWALVWYTVALWSPPQQRLFLKHWMQFSEGKQCSAKCVSRLDDLPKLDFEMRHMNSWVISPSWSGICYVDNSGLEFVPLIWASQEAGLQVCSHTQLGRCFVNCIASWFCRCVNVTTCMFINLDGVAYCITRLGHTCCPSLSETLCDWWRPMNLSWEIQNTF